jgi:hypothetical protein
LHEKNIDIDERRWGAAYAVKVAAETGLMEKAAEVYMRNKEVVDRDMKRFGSDNNALNRIVEFTKKQKEIKLQNLRNMRFEYA